MARRLTFRWRQKPTLDALLHRAFGARVLFPHVSDPVECPRCRIRTEPSFRFCTYCGHPLR